MSGILYLVSTPIGNLEDITFRAVRILNEVDVIAAEDTRQTIKLLNHFEIKKPLTSFFRHNESQKGEYIISLLLEGKNLALVSDAGTPAISDPGEELVKMAIAEGIIVIPIPGPVAATSGLIVSGMDTKRFTFEGFLPMNKKNRKERLEELKYEKRTMIFYEAPHKITCTLEDMCKAWGNRQVSLARELTKIHEEVIRADFEMLLKKFKESSPRGEFVIIIAGSEEKEENKCFWSDMSEKEHMEYYTSQGMDTMTAIKRTASDRRLPKREIYEKICKK